MGVGSGEGVRGKGWELSLRFLLTLTLALTCARVEVGI